MVKKMEDVQRNLILRLIQLTSTDDIIWYDASDATMKNNFIGYYSEFTFETLSLVDEAPKLYIRGKYMDIMLIDEVPCTLCDLMCTIHSQFRRIGITKDSEDTAEEDMERMNNLIKIVLESISS